MSVIKVLELSTGHLRLETRQALDGPNALAALGRRASMASEYGWLVCAHRHPDGDEKFAEDLAAAIQMARAEDCAYVLFDCDVAARDDLPYYDDLPQDD